MSRKLVHYVFSTEGAGLVSAKLQGEKTREQLPLSIGEGWAQLLGKPVPEGPQMDLAQPVPGAPLPLSVELAGDSAIPATLRYSAEEGDHRITFVGRTESWEVTKEVSWVDDGYELSTRVTLRNLTTRPLTGELVLPYGRAIDPAHEEKPSFFGGVGNVSDAACFVKDAYEHETVKDKLETKEHSGRGPLGRASTSSTSSPPSSRWAARSTGRCVLTTSPTERDRDRPASRFRSGRAQSGDPRASARSSGRRTPRRWRDVPELPANRSRGPASAPVQLERAVDFGIWAVHLQADAPGAEVVPRGRRQLGRGDHPAHGAGEGAAHPADPPGDGGPGGDEEAPAEDRGDEEEVSRRTRNGSRWR